MQYSNAFVKKKEYLQEATYQHSEVFEKAKQSVNSSEQEEDKKIIIQRKITACLFQLCINSNFIISKYTADFENAKNAKGKKDNNEDKPAYAADQKISQINNDSSNNNQQDCQEQAKVPLTDEENYAQSSLNFSSNSAKLELPEFFIFPVGNVGKENLESDKNTNMDLNWKVISSNSNAVTIDKDYDVDLGLILITSTKKSKCLVLSDVYLDPEKIYCFSCSFYNPLNGKKGIAIGVFEEEENNKGEKNRKRKVGDCYFASCSGSGATKIIKGDLLNSKENNYALTKIDFEVCIARQIFRVSDSGKQNINECASKESLKNGYYYQLGIEFDHPEEDNIEIVVSQAKVYELKVEQQEKYNNNKAYSFDWI